MLAPVAIHREWQVMTTANTFDCLLSQKHPLKCFTYTTYFNRLAASVCTI